MSGFFQSPFDALGPPPEAETAARALMEELPPLAEGKMFGVLVCARPDGSRETLRAFSGMLNGSWRLPGFCGPLFDEERRAAVEVPGEQVVKGLWARTEAFAQSGVLGEARAALEDVLARRDEALVQLKKTHDERRKERHRLRALNPDERTAHALDQQSRGDKAERRKLDERWEAEVAPIAKNVRKLERRKAALERLRHHVCARLMAAIQDSYEVQNARGEKRSLRSLYPSSAPPSGAGDCAAPKLFAEAFARGLRPLALAEFWWGPPPPTGGRVQGAFYPACRDKCGPLLPFMLEGLAVAPPRVFTPPISRAEKLEVLHEDDWLIVVSKPHGLLSVPGKGESLQDSVLTRLRAQFPHAANLFLAHRLDLDTSGLLLAAKDAQTYKTLQRQFLRREVYKRYTAVLEGAVEEDDGTISLPLRVDLHDRPRQIVDRVHGRTALTEWQVLSRDRDKKTTRVALYPLTGRTHQLRVHAAHPEGLGAPVVGDRLYGFEGERLHLHADSLAFIHPATQKPVSFTALAPF